jgi:hypothetical protein
VSIAIAILSAIAAIIAIELLNSAFNKTRRSRSTWKSIATARAEIDNDLDLIAAKKRHPAGKGRG